MQRNDIIFSGLFAALFIALALFRIWDHFPTDIVSPYLAGVFFEQGQFEQIYGFDPISMYNNAPPEAWMIAAEARGSQAPTLYPYLYPPIWAALLAPLTPRLDIPTFVYLIYLIQIPLVFGSAFLAWKLSGRPGLFIFWSLGAIFLFLTTTIGVLALAENQPQIAIIFLIFLAFERWQAGHSRLAGVLLAVAATIKIYPLIFLLYFLVRKDLKASFSMIVTGLIILAASFILAGPELHLLYLEQLSAISGLVFVNAHNLTISALIYQISGLFSDLPPDSVRYGYVQTLPGWIAISSNAIWVLATAGLALKFASRPNVFLIVAMFVLAALFSPFGWNYYYLPVIYMAPILFFALPARPAILLVCVLFVPMLTVFQEPLRSVESINLAQICGVVAMLFALASFTILGFANRKVDFELETSAKT